MAIAIWQPCLRAGDELAGLGGRLEDAAGEARRVEVGRRHVGLALDVEALGAVEPVRLAGPDVERGVERGELRVAHRELLAPRQAGGVAGIALEVILTFSICVIQVKSQEFSQLIDY